MRPLIKFYPLVERASTFAQTPWRPNGPDGWTKSAGPMTASVTISRRGDGSAVVRSAMGTGTQVRRREVVCANEAEALAKAEALKLELDSRSL